MFQLHIGPACAGFHLAARSLCDKSVRCFNATMMLPCFQPCRYESNLPWRGHSHRWVEKSNHRETFDTIKKGSLRLAKIIQTEACHKILRVDLVFFCISCIPW